MKHILRLLILLISTTRIVSCSGDKQTHEDKLSVNGDVFATVNIDPDAEFYDSVFCLINHPKIVALQENDETMFADLEKLIAKDDKYFVLDGFSSRKVVSFTADGHSHASYGNVGQGPGEYFRPSDIDVYNGIVYILDASKRKVLKFKDSGDFISETSIPFGANAMKVLDANKMMFYLWLDGQGGDAICVTDSTMKVIASGLPEKQGDVGGYQPFNYLRRFGKNCAFYKVPSDTMYLFDDNAQTVGGIIFDFGSYTVPDLARTDYLKAVENNLLDGKRMLLDSPIKLANGYMAAQMEEDHNTPYTLLMKQEANKCGGKKYKDMDSVFDILSPLAADEEGNLISYASLEDLQGKKGYDQLPDSIKAQLENNNRILLIYPFSKLAGK